MPHPRQRPYADTPTRFSNADMFLSPGRGGSHPVSECRARCLSISNKSSRLRILSRAIAMYCDLSFADEESASSSDCDHDAEYEQSALPGSKIGAVAGW